MRRTLGSPLALVATAFLFHANGAQAQVLADAGPLQFTDQELENLLAPVALYPDPILAQVLVAASYPEEVDLAARHVSAYGESRIDDQPWDISVKAVARYEPVLNLMADRLDWTTALGQAYVEQPEDVMAAVQSLRTMARAHGNLVTTEQHEVVVEDRYIRILPAHPRVVYVPVYDPLVVYHRPIVHLGVHRGGWSFGIGFPIGVWLAYDLDWRRRHVFYHGWDPYVYRVGWIPRSRPFIVINHIYVHPRPRVVVVNRRVINRHVDYRRFARYNTVHRQVVWERHDRQTGRRYANRARSWRADGRDDRASRNPSWDRSGRMRANDDDRRAVERSAATPRSRRTQPQQAERRPPSWDRAARSDRADRNASNPSRGRTGRIRANNGDDRAADRPAATPRSRQSTAQRAAPRPQSWSQPQRAERQPVRSNRAETQQQRQSSRPRVDRSRARSAPSRAQRGEARTASPGRSERKSVPKSRSAGRRRGSK